MTNEWHDMTGGDWGWMFAMMLFWVAMLGVAVWAVVALVRRDGGGGMTALEELDRRLARGEIEIEEYTRRRDVMRPAAS